MKTYQVLVIMIALCHLIFVGKGFGRKEQARGQGNLGLEQHDKETNLSALNENDLIYILRNSQTRTNNPTLVAKAIQQLGEMHSTEAIPLLVDLLMFDSRTGHDYSPASTRELGRGQAPIFYVLENCPALGALVNIGPDVFPYLFLAIANRENINSLYLEFACYVVLSIESDIDKALIQFTEFIEKEEMKENEIISMFQSHLEMKYRYETYPPEAKGIEVY